MTSEHAFVVIMHDGSKIEVEADRAEKDGSDLVFIVLVDDGTFEEKRVEIARFSKEDYRTWHPQATSSR